jgi:outer membrane murein-binding lipoprotein Lpp
VSGSVDTISGDLDALELTVNAATGNIDTISGAVEDLLNAEVADDTAFNTVSGSVDTISGDLDALELTVDTATGNIDTISGAVEDLLNAEVADDTAFNTVSGSVDTISGDLDALELTVDAATGDITLISGRVDTATGDIDEISGVVQTLSANSTTYGDADVATYLNGNLDTHIIPDTNSTYDIGEAENKIRHLYLSSNSLYIGETNLSATEQGAIVFPSGITALETIDMSGDLYFNKIGNTTATSENDIIKYNGEKWIISENPNDAKIDSLSGTLNAATGDIDTISGAVQELLTDETKDDAAFDAISGRIDSVSGDLYGFYNSSDNIISGVSGDFSTLSFGTFDIPSSSSSTGSVGQIAYTQDHLYICVAPNTWRRWMISDF